MGKNYRPAVHVATVSARIPEDVHAVLLRAADAEKRSLSNYLMTVLTKHAEELQANAKELPAKDQTLDKPSKTRKGGK